MIKKTTFLLALIIAPALSGMDVDMAKLVDHYVKWYPDSSKEEKIGKLKAKISKLDSWIAEMEKAPRHLDHLTKIEKGNRAIQAAWEAIDILNGQQPSALEKTVERLGATQSRFESFIQERCEEQKAVEYYNNHNKSAIQPARELPPDWNLSAAILSNDPDAETKIATQIQALEKCLEETTNHKQKARLEDELAWAKVQQKINARFAKK